MYKINLKSVKRLRYVPLSRLFRIMKLTILFLLIGFIQVSAASYGQTLSIKKQDMTYRQLFKEISSQTGFEILLHSTNFDVNKRVDVDFKSMPLMTALSWIKSKENLDFKIEGQSILLRTLDKEIMPKESQQMERVRGTVTDGGGKPLAGVTVKVKGKNTSAVTNEKGEFSVLVVLNQDVLLVSMIGYNPREVKVNSSTPLSVKLQIQQTDIEDVTVTVNTGYQRIRPEQSTGAIATLGEKEYSSRINTNFLDGLTNRLPGLMINNDVQFTSNGTSRPLFNIRGISTMSANQSPLIVVDGYPTELTLDMLDPNEISSVTILKDAAAATVYGVRASNGVIVVNRKQAAIGKPKFAFRATAGIRPSENYNRYRWDDNQSEVVMAYQKSLHSANINSNTWHQAITATLGREQRPEPFFILAQLAGKAITQEQADQRFAELMSYDNKNDYRKLFLQTAVNQTYNFNVSGGSDKATYYLTANYINNRPNSIANKNSRFMLSGRSNLKLSQKLSLEFTTDYQEQFAKSSPVPGIASMAPYERLQDLSGAPNFITGSGISPVYNSYLVSQGLYDQLYYPLVDVNEINDKTNSANNRFTANFNYKLGHGFDLSFGGIYETSRADVNYLASEQSSVARRYVNSYATRSTDGILNFPVPRGGFLRQDDTKTSSYTGRAQLNYNKTFKEVHTVNAIAGAEVRNLVYKSHRSSYFGYNDETLLHQPVDYASIATGMIRGTYNLPSALQNNFNSLFDQQYVEDRFISAYTNMVYSYKDTYSLTGSMRIDQSNLFGTDPKYKYKPLWSLGAAWNIHKESFMQHIDAIDQLKLRAAYGFNGNVAKMSLPEVVAQSALNQFTFPRSTSLELASYANSSLRWEQTKNINIGLDYGLLKNISGSIDLYKKKSTDLLGSALIDPTIGVSPSLINKANINNTGIEFALRADWIATDKLNWNTGLILARNTSKVAEVYQRGDYNPETLQAIGFVKGYPVGALFSHRWVGLDGAGYPIIKDDQGKEFSTNVNIPNNGMYELMRREDSGLTYYQGSSIPTFNAGLSNRVDIGNFYIFAMINYYGGFKTRIPRANPSLLRPLEGAGSYWKQAGDENTTDVMALVAFEKDNPRNAYNYADTYVVNGAYITLGDLTLSYNFNQSSFIKRARFTNFEVKAQASNLWTKGFNSANYSVATGSYQKTYMTPTYTLGIFTNF